MEKQISELKSSLANIGNIPDLEQLKAKYLGKSGIVTVAFKDLKSVPVEQKKDKAEELNKFKNEVLDLLNKRKENILEESLKKKLAEEKLDITLPTREKKSGSIHPISHVIDEITDIFGKLGFSVVNGPEIEDDFHNFTALNIPENHPARQMHDTFYTKDTGERNVLRTHTSSVQIHAMQSGKPPYRIIAPGKTYRCDMDITHSPMFHQIEGLLIDKNITMANLKYCLRKFIEDFFEIENVDMRFRPSFFPFTEPSAEVDIACDNKNGSLNILEKSSQNNSEKKWLEVLGCGMVHPNVLKNVGVDPKEYQGFAFGLGVERLAMLKYGITDLRTFFENDTRWLEHYKFNGF